MAPKGSMKTERSPLIRKVDCPYQRIRTFAMLTARSGRDRCAGAGGDHGLAEGVDVVGAVVALSVDEERRRTGDAADVGAVDVLGDLRSALVFADSSEESRVWKVGDW